MTYEEMLETLTEEQRSLISGKTHTLNQEAIKHRLAAQEKEKALAKIKTHLGVDEITDEYLAEQQAKAEEKLSVTEKLKAAERKLAERDAHVAKLTGDLGELTSAQRSKVRDDSILSAIGKLGLRTEAHDAARKLISMDAQFNTESGTWKFGDSDLETYLTKWKADNAYLLANPVAPGAARPGSSPTPGVPGAGRFTKAQYEAMTPAERKVHKVAILASVPTWYKD